jgi:hypothetical protein
MKRSGLLLVLIFLFTFSSKACECIFPANYDFGAHARSYPLIFYGEVVSIQDEKDPNFKWIPDLVFDSLYYKTRGYNPEFRVIKRLKGRFGKAVKRGRLTLGSGFSSCSRTFSLGQRYLVFAYRHGDGPLETNICAPNRKISGKQGWNSMRNQVKKALRQKSPSKLDSEI